MNPDLIVKRTKVWLADFVIGLQLCPFASVPYAKHLIRISVCSSLDADGIKSFAMEEAKRLLASTPAELETTLVVCPYAPEDFMDYLSLADQLEDDFFEEGYEGIIQIATFHPNYRFADSIENDPADYTNRSPYPMFHILREDSVSMAVASHPDIEQVPVRNQLLLRDLGMDSVRAILNQINKKVDYDGVE
jgi:uncharacterized protein